MNTRFPSHLNSLDFVRGLSALSVVLWHWQIFFFAADGHLPEGFDRTTQPLYWILYPFYEHGSIAVSFFFILSGFVFFWLYQDKIGDRSCSLRNFSVLRFARLYPLHLATLIIMLLGQWAFISRFSHFFIFENNDLFHFLLQLAFISGWGFHEGPSFNGPIWSVSMEVGLYALFFLAAFFRATGWRSTLAIVIVVFVSRKIGLNSAWMGAIENFFIGGLTFAFLRYYLGRPNRPRYLDILLILAPFMLWFSMGISDTMAYIILNKSDLFSRLLFPLTICGMVLLECLVGVNFSRFRWVGDMTYSTYLLHFPLQLGIVYLVFSMGYDNTVFYSPWMLGGFFAVLIPLSLVTFHYFERPAQSFLRQRLLKREKPDLEKIPAPPLIGEK